MLQALAPLAIGAVVGGAKAALGGGGFKGKKERVIQQPLYDKPTMENLNWLQQQGRQNMDFDAITNRETNQFNRQTVPGIAERFAGAFGGQGGQRSSAFAGALGNAGADLHERLASLRSQFGLQQMNMGLRPQFENVMSPRVPGIFEGMFEGATNMLPGMAQSGMLTDMFKRTNKDQSKAVTAGAQPNQTPAGNAPLSYGGKQLSPLPPQSLGWQAMGYGTPTGYGNESASGNYSPVSVPGGNQQAWGPGFTNPAGGFNMKDTSGSYQPSLQNGQISPAQIAAMLPILQRLQSQNYQYGSNRRGNLPEMYQGLPFTGGR